MKIDIFSTDKKYDIIYADPPYRFSQGISARKTFLQKGFKEELNIHYKTMSDKEIIAFKFSQIAAENSVLLCWTTDAHLPVCLEMIKQNGFIYKTVAFVWDKMKAYAGKWNVKQCELCLLATKGTAHKLIKSFKVRQLIREAKTKHSVKPVAAYNRVEEMFGEDTNKIELFARSERNGWDCWGDEV